MSLMTAIKKMAERAVLVTQGTPKEEKARGLLETITAPMERLKAGVTAEYQAVIEEQEESREQYEKILLYGGIGLGALLLISFLKR